MSMRLLISGSRRFLCTMCRGHEVEELSSTGASGTQTPVSISSDGPSNKRKEKPKKKSIPALSNTAAVSVLPPHEIIKTTSTLLSDDTVYIDVRALSAYQATDKTDTLPHACDGPNVSTKV